MARMSRKIFWGLCLVLLLGQGKLMAGPSPLNSKEQKAFEYYEKVFRTGTTRQKIRGVEQLMNTTLSFRYALLSEVFRRSRDREFDAAILTHYLKSKNQAVVPVLWLALNRNPNKKTGRRLMARLRQLDPGYVAVLRQRLIEDREYFLLWHLTRALEAGGRNRVVKPEETEILKDILRVYSEEERPVFRLFIRQAARLMPRVEKRQLELARLLTRKKIPVPLKHRARTALRRENLTASVRDRLTRWYRKSSYETGRRFVLPLILYRLTEKEITAAWGRSDLVNKIHILSFLSKRPTFTVKPEVFLKEPNHLLYRFYLKGVARRPEFRASPARLLELVLRKYKQEETVGGRNYLFQWFEKHWRGQKNKKDKKELEKVVREFFLKDLTVATHDPAGQDRLKWVVAFLLREQNRGLLAEYFHRLLFHPIRPVRLFFIRRLSPSQVWRYRFSLFQAYLRTRSGEEKTQLLIRLAPISRRPGFRAAGRQLFDYVQDLP